MKLDFQDWGEVEYTEAVERQLLLLEQVAAGEKPNTLVFCSHPPVVTLGRSSKPEDLAGWQGPVVQSSRGGRATYHGPEQLVIYPVFSLANMNGVFADRDVHAYLRFLESTLIDSLKPLGIEASSLPPSIKKNEADQSQLLYTGVWVGEQKLGSIGIAVKKWVTYHGAAINLYSSQTAFSGISPCGFQQNTMTSLEHILGKRPDKEMLTRALTRGFEVAFDSSSHG